MNASTSRSFYEVLEIQPNAQKKDIRSAYRRLALRYHPDKNMEDISAKALFQEIQAAYETLSEDDKRKRYDRTAGLVQSIKSTRTWREPSYGPCNTYPQDPPFWSVELRAMTVRKCARITKLQHLEQEIRVLVLNLDDLIAAENTAASKEKEKNPRPRFSLLPSSRSSKHLNAQRRGEFQTRSAHINARLDAAKTELRLAHQEHRVLLERDNERKIWWARERVRRVEEENRRAATTATTAAREQRNRNSEAARAGDKTRQEEILRRARAAKAREEMRKRTDGDPEFVERRRREAREWVRRQREELRREEEERD